MLSGLGDLIDNRDREQEFVPQQNIKKAEEKKFYINKSVSKKYLVNDFLTCIPGTKTLWHDLLDIDNSISELTFETTSSKNMDEFRKKLKNKSN